MRDHGYARYRLDGCRCYICARAVSEYEARRQRLIAYGRWHPYVDAEPVRAHVRTLMAAGIGRRTISRASGVSTGALSKLLYGRHRTTATQQATQQIVPQQTTPQATAGQRQPGPKRQAGATPSRRIRPETAERLLRLTPSLDLLADGALIDATGTTRRLQALIATGWPQATLADHLGWTPANFGRLLYATRATAGTARAVRTLYDDLWNTPPDEPDPARRRAAARARNTARRNAWPPPMAWDDDTIDDPAATGDRTRAGRTTTIAIAENTLELIAQGHTRAQAAERLGITISTANAALSYHRKRGTA